MNEKMSHILHNLGNGLVMRKGTVKDADQLPSFNGRIHSDEGPEQPDKSVSAWTMDLLSKPHPTFRPCDFTVVEDTQSGEIVSSMNIISQTWSYAGIPFGVGQIEMVGTLPEYRNRGLVRAQFDVVHALNHAFPDCWWKNDETFGLMSVIFPKQSSNVWSIT